MDKNGQRDGESKGYLLGLLKDLQKRFIAFYPVGSTLWESLEENTKTKRLYVHLCNILYRGK